MPGLSNEPPKKPTKIEKVGKSIRWHHIAAGLLIYALIAGGLIWHATQHNQPTSRAAAVDQTSTSGACASANCNMHVAIDTVILNYGEATTTPTLYLTSEITSFGNCNGNPGQPFQAEPDGTIDCYGFQFGPPNGVNLEYDGNLPANYSYSTTPWQCTSNCGGVSCPAQSQYCTFNIGPESGYTSSNPYTIDVSLNLVYNPPSSGGSSGSCTPSTPSLSINSSGQTSISLSWSASSPGCSGDFINYNLYYNGGQRSETGNTSDTITGLTCNTGYSFYVQAIEFTSNFTEKGTSTSATRSTSTTSCPSSGGGSSGGGSGSGTSGSGTPLPPSNSGSTSKSSSSTSSSKSVGSAAAKSTGSSAALLSPQGNQTTSTPPNTPSGFTASTAANSVIVNLSWDAPLTGSAVSNYELDRSTDNGANWQVLSSNIQNTFFSDLTTNFSTHYLYRLVAKNASGNSGYAYANISTSAFKANAGSSESTMLTSSDGVASALIPVGALTQQAACGLAINPVLDSPNVKGYVPVAGPYTITCKTQSGSTIQSYAKPLTITVKTNNAIFNKYKNLAYYGEQTSSQNWDALVPVINSSTHVATFQLTNGYSFIVMGQPSHAPWWVSFLIILFVIALIIGGGILVIRTINSRKQEEAYDVNYRKEWGL